MIEQTHEIQLWTGADPEHPLPGGGGGAQVTNEAEGFTEEEGGEGGHPHSSRGWGSGVSPCKMLGICIKMVHLR